MIGLAGQETTADLNGGLHRASADAQQAEQQDADIHVRQICHISLRAACDLEKVISKLCLDRSMDLV